MTYRITVDTGGTFTDLVLATDEELGGFFKSPTTPEDIFVGIRASLEQAAASDGISVETLLSSTGTFVYSTTQGTNAILTKNTAKTAFVTTAGHGDILVYREGGKPDAFDLTIQFPEPYVSRTLTFEVEERILSDGTVMVALNEADVMGVIEDLAELGVEAVGVCLLWSVVNSDHEDRIGQLFSEHLPEVEVTLSHDVNPIIREFRRASASVIDASLKPVMRDHLGGVDARLRELGYEGQPLSVTHVTGGVLSLQEMCEVPLQSVDSGPALGPVAGLMFAQEELATETPDVIVADIGGTSCDISIVIGGELTYTREKWLGPEYLGHPTGMHAVDTRSVGAGGGSVAHVDKEGVLHVGPESAGADPGPACYGRGGAKPTVTDAAAVLGYLDQEYFAGGQRDLDLGSATSVVQAQIAEPLGLDLEEGAAAILTVATEAMRSFVHDMTVRQGLDPRSCLLIAGGGAAGLTMIRVASELEVPEMVIPAGAGVLCAIGGQYADIVSEFSRRTFTDTRDFDADRVNATLTALDEEVDAFFERLPDDGERRREFLCEARYFDQNWEIDVTLPFSRFAGEADVQKFEDEFHRVHQRLFAVNQPGQGIELINWRARARQVRGKPAISVPAHASDGSESSGATTRRVWERSEWKEFPVHYGPALPPLGIVEGPAVIEDPTTTIVLPTQSKVQVTKHRNYRIEVGSESRV